MAINNKVKVSNNSKYQLQMEKTVIRMDLQTTVQQYIYNYKTKAITISQKVVKANNRVNVVPQTYFNKILVRNSRSNLFALDGILKLNLLFKEFLPKNRDHIRELNLKQYKLFTKHI